VENMTKKLVVANILRATVVGIKLSFVTLAFDFGATLTTPTALNSSESTT
jgi:hypothetical protein